MILTSLFHEITSISSYIFQRVLKKKFKACGIICFVKNFNFLLYFLDFPTFFIHYILTRKKMFDTPAREGYNLTLKKIVSACGIICQCVGVFVVGVCSKTISWLTI
jgi:hypothetical protein